MCVYKFKHKYAPKEEHQSLHKGPEVVVLVDGTISILFNCNISKELSNSEGLPIKTHAIHKGEPKVTLKCMCYFHHFLHYCVFSIII